MPHFVVISVGYVTFGYAAVPSLVSRRYGVTLVSVGLLMSAILLAFGCSQVLIGRVLDDVGTVGPLLVGTPVHALLAVALDLTGTFPELLALRFLWGLVGGGLLAVGAAHIARLYEGRAATRAQGIYGGMLTVGGTIAFVLVPRLTAYTAWFGVHAVGGVLAIPALLVLVPHAAGGDDVDPGPSGTSSAAGWDFSALLRSSTIPLTAVCYVAALSSYITLSTFVTAYFRDLGVFVSLNAVVLGLASLGRIAGGLGVARWTVDDARITAVGTGVGCVGFLALAVAESPLLVALLPMVSMVAASAPFGAIYNLAAGADAGEGIGLGVVLAAGNFSALVFPAVTGAVREATGSYGVAFGLLATLNAIAVVAALRLRGR
ncbi:MAG: nitrate/nitrite transporter [Haloplanus sp.]